MPADFGSPIAQNVDVSPNKGLTMISDLMGLQQKQIGIAQAKQNLQTGQAIQQQQQAEAQQQQQAMGERQLLQKSMQAGKDPDGNHLVGDDGIGDPVAMSKFATKYMPLTGQGVVQNLLKTSIDKFNVQSTGLKLDQQQRAMLQGPMQALNVDPSNDNISNVRSTFGQFLEAHPEMGKNVASANSLLDQIQNSDPKVRGKMANSLSALLQPGTPVGTQPVSGTMDVGATIEPGVTAPAAAGGGFTPSGAPIPKTVPPQIMMDANQRPHYVGGSAAGGAGADGNAWPSSTDVQARNSLAASMQSHFDGLNASAQSLPLTTALTKTIQGLAPEAFTGVGGDKKQYMAGVLRAFGSNPTGDAQTDTNLLNKAIAQLNISSPAGTDAARQLVEAGQPNSKMDPQAIKEAAGTIAGQVKMNAAERDFLTTTRTKNGGAGDPGAYQQGRQAFEANADPRIWQYEELSKNNPVAARAFIARQPDKADLVRKAGALEGMGFFR